MILFDVGLRIKNYKSFGSNWAEIDGISPITLVVGRNNIGKSALDSIMYVTSDVELGNAQWHKRTETEITITIPLSEATLKTAFGSNVGGGQISGGPSGGSHWDQVGKHLVGKPVTLKRQRGVAKPSIVTINKVPAIVLRAFGGVQNDRRLMSLVQMLQQAVNNGMNPLHGKIVRRLLAERDMRARPSPGRRRFAAIIRCRARRRNGSAPS
jgi:hypothetical protein